MPTVHLVCGSTGAGKTTYATALAKMTGAVRFSIDEWMLNLFVADRPESSSLEWALARIERCEMQMWALANQLIARNIDVVFDLGLSRRDSRDRMRTLTAQTRAESKLHYLDVGVETRKARVLERLKQKAGTGSFEIDGAMFDMMERFFEPPSDDELDGAMILCED
jgi:predicted kinase